MQSSNVFQVPLKDIRVPRGRGRKDFKKVQDLQESIERVGLIHPLVIQKDSESGYYHLIAGETRLRAIALLGWDNVPCSLQENLTDIDQKEIELEENIQRQDLTWIEQNEILLQITDLRQTIEGIGGPGQGDTGWTQAKTAEMVGMSPQSVANKIGLAKKMKARPDLAMKVAHLPYAPAKKKFDQLVKQEKVERQAKAGQLKLSTDILCGDCTELLKGLPSQSIDLILTDPPFGDPSITNNTRKATTTHSSYEGAMEEWDNASLEYFEDTMSRCSDEFWRVLRPGAHFYIFFAFEGYPHLVDALGRQGLCFDPTPLIWYKGRATAPPTNQSYSPSYEPILFGWREPEEGGSRHMLSKDSKNLLEYPPLSSKKKSHPFEKPQDLLQFLIAQSTEMGDTVLDPFAGTGSTIRAAQKLKRSAKGFERSPKHFAIAQDLLQQEK